MVGPLLALLLVITLTVLSRVDLRVIHNENTVSPSTSSVVKFYDLFGGILMNDLYHHLFEWSAMRLMLDNCHITKGMNVVEIGPGIII